MVSPSGLLPKLHNPITRIDAESDKIRGQGQLDIIHDDNIMIIIIHGQFSHQQSLLLCLFFDVRETKFRSVKSALILHPFSSSLETITATFYLHI